MNIRIKSVKVLHKNITFSDSTGILHKKKINAMQYVHVSFWRNLYICFDEVGKENFTLVST